MRSQLFVETAQTAGAGLAPAGPSSAARNADMEGLNWLRTWSLGGRRSAGDGCPGPPRTGSATAFRVWEFRVRARTEPCAERRPRRGDGGASAGPPSRGAYTLSYDVGRGASRSCVPVESMATSVTSVPQRAAARAR
jgi:hypothetical protein